MAAQEVCCCIYALAWKIAIFVVFFWKNFQVLIDDFFPSNFKIFLKSNFLKKISSQKISRISFQDIEHSNFKAATVKYLEKDLQHFLKHSIFISLIFLSKTKKKYRLLLLLIVNLFKKIFFISSSTFSRVQLEKEGRLRKSQHTKVSIFYTFYFRCAKCDFAFDWISLFSRLFIMLCWMIFFSPSLHIYAPTSFFLWESWLSKFSF